MTWERYFLSIYRTVYILFPDLRIYKDEWLRGDQKDFTGNEINLGHDWNDKMGSAKVIRGTWKFWTDTNYQGDSMILCEGVSYDKLVHNDKYSSIQLLDNNQCSKYAIYNLYLTFNERS